MMPYNQMKLWKKMELGNISNRKWSINACVATTGEGVEEGMKWLVETVSKSQGA